MDKSPVKEDDVSRKEAVVCLDDFEKEAAKLLTKNAFDYIRSGADDESYA
jgi:hypothetical protein